MINPRDDHWKDLCEAILGEADSKRLMELVEKLNRTLEEREAESDSQAGNAQRMSMGLI
jgi:hypothetical protein